MVWLAAFYLALLSQGEGEQGVPRPESPSYVERARERAQRVAGDAAADWAPPPATQQKASPDNAPSGAVLDQMARSPDPAVRRRAVEGIARLPDTQAVPWLLKALGDPAPSVRDAAVHHLSRARPEQVAAAVSEVLVTGDPAVAAALDETLPRLRESLERVLLNTLEDPGELPMFRQVAAYALGRMGSSKAAEPLKTALGSDNPGMAYAAAEALYFLSDGSYTDTWMELTNHPNPNVRWMALDALARHGNPKGEAFLQDMAYGRRPAAPALQQRAVDAIATWDPERAVPELIAVMQHNGALRQYTVSWLQQITGLNIGADPAAWTQWYLAYQGGGEGEGAYEGELAAANRARYGGQRPQPYTPTTRNLGPNHVLNMVDMVPPPLKPGR